MNNHGGVMTEALQIGDRVRRVQFDNQYVKVGTEGTVMHQPDGSCVMVKWDGLDAERSEGAAYNIPTFVEKITPVKSTFKVGDKVQICVDECAYSGAYKRGDIVTIKDTWDTDQIDVKKDEHHYRQTILISEVAALTPPQFIHHRQEGDTPESIAAEQEDSVFPPGDLMGILPTDNAARKAIPIATGVLDYFPAALVEVAKVSKIGSDQHHPGQPLHWERGKSMDQADTLLRHLLERGTFDTDGTRHSAKVAWRALALLQQELEAEGAPVSRGSR